MEELEIERLQVKGTTYLIRDASKQEKLTPGDNIKIENNVISAVFGKNNIVSIDASTIVNNDLANITNVGENDLVVLSNLTDEQTYSYTNSKGVTKHFVGNSDYDLIFRSCGGGRLQPLSFPIALD